MFRCARSTIEDWVLLSCQGKVIGAIPSTARRTSRRDPRFFCQAHPLPALSTQSITSPVTTNHCRFGLASVTCGGAWANCHLQTPPLALWVWQWCGVRQHPFSASTVSSSAALRSPAVQWEGSFSLVISSSPTSTDNNHRISTTIPAGREFNNTPKQKSDQ